METEDTLRKIRILLKLDDEVGFLSGRRLIYSIPRRDGPDGAPEGTAWGVFPPLTTMRDEQYRLSLLDTNIPVESYPPCLTDETTA